MYSKGIIIMMINIRMMIMTFTVLRPGRTLCRTVCLVAKSGGDDW